MYAHLKKVTFLPTAFLVASCAGFQAHNLPIAQDTEYKSAKHEKIKLFSRWKIEAASSLVNQDIATTMYKKSFDKAIIESGCCDIVESPTEAALVIDVTAVDHSNAAALVPAVITGLSLYTIPSWVTQTIDLKVNAKSGHKENSYQLNDSFTLVQWLPMAFAFPFKGGPMANTDELNSNTYKNLIIQLKNDGYL
jgi:hypothetical protein